MEILARVSHEMTIGEALEFEHEDDHGVTEEQYFDVIRAKTASLIAGACQIGASVNGKAKDKARVKRFRDFGDHVGMAFQITDDLFDYVGDPTSTGKGVGGDLESGKITLPLIHALAQGGKDGKRVADLIEKKRLTPTEWSEMVGLLERNGSLEYATSRAYDYAKKARRALAPEPTSAIKDALDASVDYAISRLS
jgi:octaprenyl-diphosphate synthase